MTAVLSLRIFILKWAARDVLHLRSASLKLLSHQRVENGDDGERQEVVNCSLDDCDVSAGEGRVRESIYFRLVVVLLLVGLAVASKWAAKSDFVRGDDLGDNDSRQCKQHSQRPCDDDYHENHLRSCLQLLQGIYDAGVAIRSERDKRKNGNAN